MSSPEDTSIFSDPVFWTAVLGMAGIAAAFFAPSWSQRAIARRLERRRFRGASRLVADELNLILAGLSIVLEEARWPDDPEALFNDAAWRRLADVLAPSLTLEDWRRVAMVYDRLSRFRWRMATFPGSQLSAADKDAVQDTTDRAREARDLLVTVEPNVD